MVKKQSAVAGKKVGRAQAGGSLRRNGAPATARRQCSFPFLHFGAVHNECVAYEGQRWCKDANERWLTCRGERAPAAPKSRRGDPTTSVGWYARGSPGLQVLEMKPTSPSLNSSSAQQVDYKVCKITDSPNFKLYVPPRYTRLPLGDDEAARVKFPDGFSFPFYGEAYDEMYVGSNGYVTFDVADTNFLASGESHLQKKRISVLFSDIEVPSDNVGEIQFADLKSAVAVTWSNVTVHDPSEGRIPGQTFQVILFQDGTIWMGYEEANQEYDGAIIGLSAGPTRQWRNGGAAAQASKHPGPLATDLASLEDCDRDNP